MPDKFPLEHFYRAHHPDAWFEYWQDNDFCYGHLDQQDEPENGVYLDSGNDFEANQVDLGWPNDEFYGI